MKTRLEMVRRACMEDLPSLLEFIEDACRQAELDEETAFSVKLAVEEACTNVIRYGYPGEEPGPLHLGFRSDPREVVITIADEGIPFDPQQAPPPDLDSDWDERRIGGLGWHLIRQVMDEVHHEPGAARGNRLTLVKRRPAMTRSR